MFVSPINDSSKVFYSASQAPNFRAKVDEKSLKKVFCNSDEDYETLVHNVSRKLRELEAFGGHSTKISIGERDVETRTCAAGEYSQYYANYYFTNPILKDAHSHERVLLLGLPTKCYSTDRNDICNITDSVVTSGERKLLLNYAEKLIKYTESSKKPLLDSAKDVIERLEATKFSKVAIAKFKEYLKNIDARRALDAAINTLKAYF